MSVDPRRRLALNALLAVEKGKPLDGALARVRRELPPGVEAAAAEEMVLGALQWRARYDHLIKVFSRRKATTDTVVRGVLRLALHQLLTSRGVPAYAAVHQAGEMLRSAGRPRAVGYVNGLLQSVQRHIAQAGADDPLAAVQEFFMDPEGEVAAYLADWWSHPRWLVERWCERYGDAETEALLTHANQPPPITLHVLPGFDAAAAREAILATGQPVTTIDGTPRALRLDGRPDRAALQTVLGSAPGLLVQDAGAQQVVDWLTRDGRDLAAVSAPVLDACAAPGGKAMHLRAFMPAGGALVAMDLRPRRLRRVRENRERLALDGVALVAGDGVRPPLAERSFAAVMLDGPCSGTGVGRHHPEGRWRLRPGTLTRNGARLLELACGAADLLVPGGRLYYATCSLEPEENEDVIAALLAARGDLVPDPDPDGRHTRAWLPWRTGTDGFFAARLRRAPQEATTGS